MPYLTNPVDIRSCILQLKHYSILWLDTEVADWQTKNPRLSLIQALADPTDFRGDFAYVLDVLNQPDLVQQFVEQIMMKHEIEKVFHSASYDLQFLGREAAQNVTCTLKMARKLRRKLKTSNCKLKTLAKELCQFTDVDAEQQRSDWGKRPLSDRQMLYARMDTVYLAHVHQHLLQFSQTQSTAVSQTI